MIGRVYIVNGKPGAGKDTAVDMMIEILAPRFWTIHESTICPAKTALRALGWDGEDKSDKYRDALSVLKELGDDLFDASFVYAESHCNSNAIVFIDCREPNKIARLCKELHAKSIYIERDIDVTCTNDSDNKTGEYLYDYYINNTGKLSDLQTEVARFVDTVVIPRACQDIQEVQ